MYISSDTLKRMAKISGTTKQGSIYIRLLSLFINNDEFIALFQRNVHLLSFAEFTVIHYVSFLITCSWYYYASVVLCKCNNRSVKHCTIIAIHNASTWEIDLSLVRCSRLINQIQDKQLLYL